MPKHPEKLTISVEPDLRDELQQWAADEGRPVGNLLRRIVAKSVEQRRQDQQEARAAA